MAEATRRYMLTTTVRQAELHCSARKRRPREHARVSNVYTRMSLRWPADGRLAERTTRERDSLHAYADALTSGRGRSLGLPRKTFTFPLVCTVNLAERLHTTIIKSQSVLSTHKINSDIDILTLNTPLR